MKASDDFFAGARYAIFGVRAPGRSQGPVLVKALKNGGKTAVAVEPDGSAVEGAEVARTLAEAGKVDGVVLLPPSPWNEAADAFMKDALGQCKERGISAVWVYTAGGDTRASAIASEAGVDPVIGRCPSEYIIGGGLPHNIHRFVDKLFGKL